MDYSNYYYRSDTNVVGESDNSAVMMDSPSLLHRLQGGYVYNDLVPPEAGLGPVLDDEDPFGLRGISLMDLTGSEHLLTPSDSAHHASRELRSIFQFEEPPSLLSSLRSSSSFSRSSATPKSTPGSSYKSPGLMGLGDDVLVIDGVLVKDEKGFSTQRQSSLFSTTKKLEPSLGSHRLRTLSGITDSPWYSGRRKSSGGGNGRADGRQWKKEKTAQGGKHKVEQLEEETNCSSRHPEQTFNRDVIPCPRALATEMWRMQLDKGPLDLETSLPPEDPWPPELPFFDRKQSSAGKVYETALRPLSLPYSSRSDSSQTPTLAHPVPPPPPPPSGLSSSIGTVEQEPNSTDSLTEADEHWPTLSSTAAKGSARKAWRRSNTQPPPTPHEPTGQAPVGSSNVEEKPNNLESSQGRSIESSLLEEPSNNKQPTTPGHHMKHSESIATQGSRIDEQPHRAFATQQSPRHPPPTNVSIASYITPKKQEPTKLMGSEIKTGEILSQESPSIDRNLISGGSSTPSDNMETLQPMPPDASSSSQTLSRTPKPSALLQHPSTQGVIGSCGTTTTQEPNKLLFFEDKASEALPREQLSTDGTWIPNGDSTKGDHTESSQSQDKSILEEPSPEDPETPQLQKPPKHTFTGNSDRTAVIKKTDESQDKADVCRSTKEKPATTPPNQYLSPNKAPVSSSQAEILVAEETRARRIWAHRAKELPPLRGKPFRDFSLTDGEEKFAHILMYGPNRRHRLPVFEEICPLIPEQRRDSKDKGSSTGSKKN